MRAPRAASHASIDVFLHALEARLYSEIARTSVAAPAGHLLDAGGKRLRARLLWWSACATAPAVPDPTDERLVRAAAAIELAHLGSLIHDDIVDGGGTRRGVATLHRSHGTPVATDTGAALAHLANGLVATLGRSARRGVRRALLATCRGQVRELAVPFVPVTPQARLAIMQEKTGAFFELAGVLGAIAVHAPARPRAAVSRFARRFGVAFQIADDVLDLAGDPRELGRANGADLRDGVMTLPILLACAHEPAVTRALDRVRRTPDAKTIAACADVVTHAGGVAAAQAVATGWRDRALAALAPLGHGEAVAELGALAHASIARGIRPGAPCFSDPPTEPRSSHTTTTPFSFSPAFELGLDAGAQIGPRLTRLLNWFQPGMADMVAARTSDPTVRAQRRRARHELRGERTWHPETQTAAEAIALAHALSEPEALAHDPVRTLALIDALHCAAIGMLNQTPDPAEHEAMATRAHGMVARPIRAMGSGTSFHVPESPPLLSLAPIA